MYWHLKFTQKINIFVLVVVSFSLESEAFSPLSGNG